MGWAVTEIYRCRDCDYEGAFYLEIESNENGGNFADLDKLKKLYPDDVDNETDIKMDEKILKEPFSSDKD